MKYHKQQGFTIVELLVVIVVIGILAAITVVSYTGITTKANTAANQQNASSVQSAVATKFAESSAYPAWGTDSAATLTAINAGVSKVPATILLLNGDITAAGAGIGYRVVGTTGVCVSYWDYSVPAARYLGVGTVTVAADRSTCS